MKSISKTKQTKNAPAKRVKKKTEAAEPKQNPMIEAGVDTFWESWNPNNPDDSPYGGSVINSSCHGWSCTPAYILRSLRLKNVL